MGEVYLAHDTRLGRNVAVKLLRSALTSNPDAVRRFEQEARAASSLNHPNIVTIHEIGDLLERRFIAMELVEGPSLAAMIGTPLDVTALARIGAQLARALSVAHAAGIVHRDIKPENVIVREDGYVKVLDFGLARLAPPPTVAAGRRRDESRACCSARRATCRRSRRAARPRPARATCSRSASCSTSSPPVRIRSSRRPRSGRCTRSRRPPVPSPLRWVPGMPAPLERLLLWMLDKAAAARPTAAEVEAELVTAGGRHAGAGRRAAARRRPAAAASRAQPAVAADGAGRPRGRARERQGHAAPVRRPAVDAHGSGRHRQDAAGDSGGRGSRRSLRPAVRRRRHVRQSRADRRSDAGRLRRRAVARRSGERRPAARCRRSPSI